MIGLVKSESFKAYENAYNACFSTSYADEKKKELGKEHVRLHFLNRNREIVDTLKRKGFDHDYILGFIDSVRDGTMVESLDFVERCKYKGVPRDSIVEIVSDIESEKILTMAEDFEKSLLSKEPLNEELLKELIFATSLYVELRVDSYNLLSMYGIYDSWCASNKIIVKVHQIFKTLYHYYEKMIISQLKLNMGIVSSSSYQPEISRTLTAVYSGGIDASEYGLNEYDVKICAVLHHISDLTNGRCEWFWNED